MWRGLLRLELVVEFWEVSQDRESVRRLAARLVIIIRQGPCGFLQLMWFVSHCGHCHNCFHDYYHITINSNIITLLPYQQGHYYYNYFHHYYHISRVQERGNTKLLLSKTENELTVPEKKGCFKMFLFLVRFFVFLSWCHLIWEMETLFISE